MSAQMLEVSLLRVGTVLRLERDAWSMAKCLRQAANEYAPPPAKPKYMTQTPMGQVSNGYHRVKYTPAKYDNGWTHTPPVKTIVGL